MRATALYIILEEWVLNHIRTPTTGDKVGLWNAGSSWPTRCCLNPKFWRSRSPQKLQDKTAELLNW